MSSMVGLEELASRHRVWTTNSAKMMPNGFRGQRGTHDFNKAEKTNLTRLVDPKNCGNREM